MSTRSLIPSSKKIRHTYVYMPKYTIQKILFQKKVHTNCYYSNKYIKFVLHMNAINEL